MKLKIGLTNRSYKSDDYNYSRVNKNYVNTLLSLNTCPIIIPNADYNTLKEIMNDLDGLIICGGDDVNPCFYNEDITFSKPFEIEDDKNDLNLIKICLELNKPILGICRGMQIINVYFGGSLYQDILKDNLTKVNHNQDKNPGYEYFANFKENTIMNEIYGNRHKINSFHHQAIKNIGKDLVVSGISDDGVIEAIELDKKILAVQWHPEQLTNDTKHLNLFKKFIEYCAI